MTHSQLYILLDLLGLPKILEQNDIEEIDVLEILIQRGLIDPQEYLFEDETEIGEED